MPFSWYHYTPPEAHQAEEDSKGEAQVADRIREQARILCNLGYDIDTVTQRVRVDLKWEWELPRGRAIPCWDQVDEIVAQTFSKGVRDTECAFRDPAKVHEEIRAVYERGALDPGAC